MEERELKCDKHCTLFQSSPKDHKTHLHTMKVVMILIPSFHGLRWECHGACPPICDGNTQKKAILMQFLESRSAKANSIMGRFYHRVCF